jgi:putative aldouronate transport system permease protein
MEKKKKQKIFTAANVTLYLMFLPVFLYYAVFSYVPMLGLSISFMDFRASGFRSWVGFENFEYIFKLPFFWRALRNTISFTFLNYLLAFPAPIILALLLNEIRLKFFKKVIQTFSVMPHFISWVVVSGLFISILSPTTGYVNEIIKFFGGEPVYFFAKVAWFQIIISLIRVWKGVGYSAIIYLAALSSVDQELYEAAVIDGANRWQQTIHITLTAIRPVILVVLVLSFAGVLNLFEPVFVFTNRNDIVLSTGEVLDTYIYKNGVVQGKYPVSTAVGLFKSVISLLLVLGTNWLSKRISEDKRAVI